MKGKSYFYFRTIQSENLKTYGINYFLLFSSILFIIIFSISAAQFKIKLMFTGSRQPIYTYGAIQIKLISKEGINETFTLTR